MRGQRILVVDDNQDIRELLECIFKRDSIDIRSASSGPEGLRQLYAFQPDLVILDILMPGMDGWETLRRIRQLTDVPVIILSALNMDEDIVRGFDLGAHDFVTKPFSADVLLARAERLLRQRTATDRISDGVAIFDDGYLQVDLEFRKVLVEGREVTLTRTDYDVFEFLVRHKGQVLSKRQILAAVWGWEYIDHPEYVHTYISRLRRKLERDPATPKYILTEHGLGYCFAGVPDFLQTTV
ncbi:MAG: response regulator transcription factor [Chloroflexota bacterium]|nr:response regulator transcription factor [Chloroflexota bacterium]